VDIIPGIYNLTDEQYHHTDPWSDAISSTFLKNLIGKSPQHAIFERSNPTDKAELRFGKLFHTILLEPDKFADKVVFWNGRRTGKKYNELAAVVGDRAIVNEREHDQLRRMRDAVMKMETAKGLFSAGMAEESFFFVDGPTGLMCRCRPDWQAPKIQIIADLKTTSNPASKQSFSRTIAQFHYDLQAAFYMGGVNSTLTKRPKIIFDTWIWIVAEVNPPYGVGIYEAEHNVLENGRAKVRWALDKCSECYALDEWGGYADEVVKVDIPGWANWKKAGHE